MVSPEKILQKYWGYNTFRPLQKEIIESVIQKNNTLALLPTGGGKSICFQVPALMFEGVCLVISPLIALMKDQVNQLNQRGIAAEAIFSGLSFKLIEEILDKCQNQEIKFLYVSPERLKTRFFVERLKYIKVCLLAVDEAHCISMWGYDFRPTYLLIKDILPVISKIPIIALTATATKDVRKDIIEKLGLKSPNVFVQSFARKNLVYGAFESEQKDFLLLDILKKYQGSAIIYAKTRKRTVEFSDFLKKNNFSADYYHAGLTIAERSKKQDNWVSDKIMVMVATNAFGMGIDKANVRLVVHVDLPENLEAYYQESGRAGRDEQLAWVFSIFNRLDLDNLDKNLELKYPSNQTLKHVYQCLCNYYKLALGSETYQSFDFDINEFCSTFGLNPYETHFALKLLEIQNIIYLNEAFFNPSRIKIIVNAKVFFDFQERHPNLIKFTKIILRVYGGEVFASYTIISEQELSKNAEISTDETLKNLVFLSESKIIDYQPQKNKAQLGFLTARQNVENLTLHQIDIDNRKLNDKKALKTIKNYVLNKSRCRMRIIQDYFDEENTQNCGICDNCMSQQKMGLTSQEIEKYFSIIKSKLPTVYNTFENDTLGLDNEAIMKVLKIKIEFGEIGIDEFGLIFLK